MDALIEQALKKHKIIRYLNTFEEVMLTYKTLLEAEWQQKNIAVQADVSGELPLLCQCKVHQMKDCVNYEKCKNRNIP